MNGIKALLPTEKEDEIELATLTPTGAASSGLTIPKDILDSLGWERKDKLRIARFGQTLVITKIEY